MKPPKAGNAATVISEINQKFDCALFLFLRRWILEDTLVPANSQDHLKGKHFVFSLAVDNIIEILTSDGQI